MPQTLVLQSHRYPLPHAWLNGCIESVKHWCALNGFHHKFIGDELLDLVAPSLVAKTHNQRVITTDLARLKALQNTLSQGVETAIWCDADLLIFDPDGFTLPDDNYAVGREVWIQADRDKPRKLIAHVKVHNAFLMFRAGNSFLDFYTETAERLLIDNSGPMPPQFIGPKLLTALHNVIRCPVAEAAGMFSPLVSADIAVGGGPALELFKRRSAHPVAAANLCASGYERGDISDATLRACIGRLLDDGISH